MATYLELINEVLDIIPMPNRDTLIRSKINQVIRYLAGSGDYFRAIEETTIGATEGVDPAAYVQQIDQSANFRSLLYVQYPSSVSTKNIKVNHIKDVLHLQQCQKAEDVAYVSGSYIRIKHSVLSATFNIGYYTFPAALVADDDTNWLTEAVPGLIVDFTVAYILNLDGANEDANRVQQFTGMMQVPFLQAQINGAINA